MKDSQDWLERTIDETLRNRVKFIGDNEWSMIGYPGEVIQELKSAIRKHILQEVEQELEHFRPPSMLDEVMQLGHTSTHEYRGERYNSCALCGNCPGAMTKYIDDRLAELRNKFNDKYKED